MKKTSLPTIFLITFFLTAAPVVLAQESSSTTTTTTTTNTTAPTKMPFRPTAVKDLVQIRRENLASKAAELRADRMAKIEAKRSLLKTRLLTFKDKIKSDIIDRADKRLTTINENRTAAMTRHLDQMTQLVIRAETALTTAAGAGKDIASASATIAEAKLAIDKAQVAVEVQAGNDYVINVTTETKAKTEVKATRDKLHTDIKATHELVLAARKATVAAIKQTVLVTGGQ